MRLRVWRRRRLLGQSLVRAEPLVPHVLDVLRRIGAGSLRPGGTAFQADDGHRRDVVVGRGGDCQVAVAAEWARAEVGRHHRRVTPAAGWRAWEKLLLGLQATQPFPQ